MGRGLSVGGEVSDEYAAWLAKAQREVPPLAEVLRWEGHDSNVFWRLGSGVHEGLLGQAVEAIEGAIADLEGDGSCADCVARDLRKFLGRTSGM